MNIQSGSLDIVGTICTSEPSYAPSFEPTFEPLFALTPTVEPSVYSVNASGYMQFVIYTSIDCVTNATYAETFILNHCIEYSIGSNTSSKQITYDGSSLFNIIEYSDATCGNISTSHNFNSSALEQCFDNSVDDNGIQTYAKFTYIASNTTDPFRKPTTMASSATAIR